MLCIRKVTNTEVLQKIDTEVKLLNTAKGNKISVFEIYRQRRKIWTPQINYERKNNLNKAESFFKNLQGQFEILVKKKKTNDKIITTVSSQI